MTIKFIDLFAGVGGFHSALNGLAECVFASEIDKNARLTYQTNWENSLKKNQALFAGDIQTIPYSSLPDFDILCAGFPCQPFSIAGKQLGFSHVTQGTLFFNILEIAKIKKPRVLFLENVKNLVSHDKGKTFKIILNSLQELGYFIHYKILNSKTYANIPQNRERIFIIAFQKEEDYHKFSFPNPVPLHKTLLDCLETTVDKKYYQTNTKSPVIQKMIQYVVHPNTIYQYRRYYIRENKGGVCPTLTANMGTGGHNVPLICDHIGIRKLTPRECFNFQGFPSSFVLPTGLSNSALYKQAGNSVTVPLIHSLALQILKAIS